MCLKLFTIFVLSLIIINYNQSDACRRALGAISTTIQLFSGILELEFQRDERLFGALIIFCKSVRRCLKAFSIYLLWTTGGKSRSRVRRVFAIPDAFCAFDLYFLRVWAIHYFGKHAFSISIHPQILQQTLSDPIWRLN